MPVLQQYLIVSQEQIETEIFSSYSTSKPETSKLIFAVNQLAARPFTTFISTTGKCTHFSHLIFFPFNAKVYSYSRYIVWGKL